MRGYHDGQLAVQRRAGATEMAERLERGIRGKLPDAARAFLAAQRLLLVASTDPAGQVWCSLLSGRPGYITTPDEATVAIAAPPPPGDPLAAALAAGPGPVGLLAIEPHARRRIRINGTAQLGDGGIVVRAEQVYGNCPKYIARRDVVAERPQNGAAPAATRRRALSAAQRALVAGADTLFIATAGAAGATGADASHRGGSPGFVTVRDERRLSFPDYAGNSMYMTLGNVAANPRAGLLFVDWETGDTLQLTGRARIDWSPARAAALPGAQRVVDFELDAAIHRAGALPLRWALEERSPFNPPVSSPA